MRRKALLITNESSGNPLSSPEMVLEKLIELGIPHVHRPVKTFDEIHQAVSRISRQEYDAVIVFGGDGTVTSVMKCLPDSRIPLLILPGGTANVLANMLKVPGRIKKSLELFSQQSYIIRHIDVAKVGQEPFVLDMHFGWIANSTANTSGPGKRWLGQIAYNISAIKQMAKLKKQKYQLKIGNERLDVEGYACYIANHSNPKLLSIRLFRRPQETLVKMIIIRKADPISLLRWAMSRLFFHRNINDIVLFRQAEQITIKKAPSKMIIDDTETKAVFPMIITGSTSQSRFIVPVQPAKGMRRYIKKTRVAYYRITDQARRVITGTPSLKYSRISNHLYLGGQYRKQAAPLFKKWGITGVVNMRQHDPLRSVDVDILHLPTPDETPPRLSDLQKGVDFIAKHIESGGAVYMHCRLGQGRGPTIAAAYLISQGMRPDDAIAHLQKYRPFAEPNQQQIDQLIKFAERYNLLGDN